MIWRSGRPPAGGLSEPLDLTREKKSKETNHAETRTRPLRSHRRRRCGRRRRRGCGAGRRGRSEEAHHRGLGRRRRGRGLRRHVRRARSRRTRRQDHPVGKDEPPGRRHRLFVGLDRRRRKPLPEGPSGRFAQGLLRGHDAALAPLLRPRAHQGLCRGVGRGHRLARRPRHALLSLGEPFRARTLALPHQPG